MESNLMAENKTRKTTASVTDFIKNIPDETRRKDCQTVLKMMKAATGAKPAMWGSSIVGFGDFRYKYDSGREGDWFLAGFSPRKDNLTLYLVPGLDGHAARLKQLGKVTTGKSCLHIKRLSDVDPVALKQLIADGVKAAKAFAATRGSS
jgi:hypothetical protein